MPLDRGRRQAKPLLHFISRATTGRQTQQLTRATQTLGDENKDKLQPVRRESARPNTLLLRIPRRAFCQLAVTDSEKSCRGLKEVNPE